ncbi:aminotransferase class IV [Cytophagales bacterium LB-30]|uniref:branched-chain-amino-acid transaminase n=1 Tax=Shiella aurantiaca TaxID=3058365 RepID=A0ABT8F5N8_9BACT|nr:aminotransferase class IV [Shiella aurantiaca]MDN4165276.1 aminotransferase class IV [Shiella aurantiaca]
MKEVLFFDGAFVLPQEAKVAVTDIGLIRGYAIFDFLRVQNHVPLFVEDYIARFMRSAELMRLPLAYSAEDLKGLIVELVARNGYSFAGIRLVLSGGISPDNFSVKSGGSLAIIEKVYSPVASEVYQMGAQIISRDYVRSFPEIKTTHYAFAINVLQGLANPAIEELLYTHEGFITECSRSNIFLIKNGVLITPHASILWGVTRKYTLKVAQNILPVEERPVRYAELLQADEVFITSTTKKLLPVVKVDEHSIGNGRPGPLSQQIMAAFDQEERRYTEAFMPNSLSE